MGYVAYQKIVYVRQSILTQVTLLYSIFNGFLESFKKCF